MKLSVGIRDYGRKEFDWVPDIAAATIHDAVKHAFIVAGVVRAFDWSVEIEVRTSSPENRPNDSNVVHRQRVTPTMIARWISA